MSTISLVETAYQEIRKKIIIGEYLPGNLLSENELANNLNMSRTPIRGAISRLESEGLVTSLKNRGILVKNFTIKEYFDMKDLINSLHNFVIDIVLERGYSFDLQKLKNHLELQIKASKEDDYPNYIRQDILFERTILESANNQIMLQTFDSFTDKWIMMAIVNWKFTPHKTHYTTNKRNKEIYEVITSKDYLKVKQIIKESNIQSRQRYLVDGSI
jgi:DNA-binding GntR family transcriptional regulator